MQSRVHWSGYQSMNAAQKDPSSRWSYTANVSSGLALAFQLEANELSKATTLTEIKSNQACRDTVQHRTSVLRLTNRSVNFRSRSGVRSSAVGTNGVY